MSESKSFTSLFTNIRNINKEEVSAFVFANSNERKENIEEEEEKLLNTAYVNNFVSLEEIHYFYKSSSDVDFHFSNTCRSDYKHLEGHPQIFNYKTTNCFFINEKRHIQA